MENGQLTLNLQEKSVSKIVEELKEKDEDFEFYPTSKEMIKPIYDYIKSNGNSYGYDRKNIEIGNYSLLDIGAGTCNFQKYYSEIYRENCTDGYNQDYNFDKIQVIEKSSHLIKMLPIETIIAGVDFNLTTLIDKDIKTIFSNPPYSEYEEWTKRIIYESSASFIFMIIPKRWKENKGILDVIKKTGSDYEILGSFDFLEADRRARAYVDVVVFEKKNRDNNHAFDDWFDEHFGSIKKEEIETESDKKIKIKTGLADAKDKITFLVNCYEEDRKVLYGHFKAISTLDEEILESIGVKLYQVKSSLKEKLSSLKNKYWFCVFDELEQIREKLTTKYRSEIFNKFKSANNVDFNHDNIYATVLWILKNANQYYDNQLKDLYMDLSGPENVQVYKSNQKTFSKDQWRWNQKEHSHYTLDYQIITSKFYFFGSYSSSNIIDEYRANDVVDDFCTIAANLGFNIAGKEIAIKTGKKYFIYWNTGKSTEILFQYKIFLNGNTHIKMSLEFSKAFNVEAARLLGWIKDKSDIKKEFDHTHLKGCEQYFKSNLQLPLNGQLLLN